MKELAVNVVLLVCVFAQQERCKPKYHYWRPYNGTPTNDVFLAAVDDNSRRNFIARVIPPDQFSWTIPVQFKEYWDQLDFSWHEYKNTLVIKNFIDLLCTQEPEKLRWVNVKRSIAEVANKCCFVQGGMGVLDNHVYNAYIGRGISNGETFIGRVYLERGWDGVHIMHGRNSTKVLRNFQVLSYDCEDDAQLINKISQYIYE